VPFPSGCEGPNTVSLLGFSEAVASAVLAVQEQAKATTVQTATASRVLRPIRRERTILLHPDHFTLIRGERGKERGSVTPVLRYVLLRTCSVVRV
jgi:hypothetical protein